jgi:large subunit ribosomal protein L24
MSVRLKKADIVRIIAGKDKGKTGKIVAVDPSKRSVKVEGINIVKRAVKPSMINPQGGIKELHKSIDISKVALVHPTKKDATSKVGYKLSKEGVKMRVYKANNKEIA